MQKLIVSKLLYVFFKTIKLNAKYFDTLNNNDIFYAIYCSTYYYVVVCCILYYYLDDLYCFELYVFCINRYLLLLYTA
jgi:hypothetical protein